MDGNNMVTGTVTLTDNETGKSTELPVIGGSIGPRVIDIRKLYAQTGHFTYDPGFMATAACRSNITYIDGDEGVLLYRGYPIEELANKSDFMEVSYLLLYGELPTAKEREKFVFDPLKDGSTKVLLNISVRSGWITRMSRSAATPSYSLRSRKISLGTSKTLIPQSR